MDFMQLMYGYRSYLWKRFRSGFWSKMFTMLLWISTHEVSNREDRTIAIPVHKDNKYIDINLSLITHRFSWGKFESRMLAAYITVAVFHITEYGNNGINKRSIIVYGLDPAEIADIFNTEEPLYAYLIEEVTKDKSPA